MTFDNRWKLQEGFRDWVENHLGRTIWTPLYIPGSNSFEPNTEDRFIYSFLIEIDFVSNELEKDGFDQYDGYPGMEYSSKDDGNKVYEYFRFGQEIQEPLLFRRNFTTKPGYIEISQELVHFFQLFHDKKTENYILENYDGSEEVVIKFENGSWHIKTIRLRQYLAFKNKALVVGIVNRRHFNQAIDNIPTPSDDGSPLSEITTMNLRYQFWYLHIYGGTGFYSETFGKKIIFGIPIENTGIYPFEKSKEFESFIVGVSEDGKEIENTSNPGLLANYFGKNPDALHYLTPIYFSRDVLSKYYDNPEKYKINDGSVKIGGYILRADTNHPEHVVVFLGDLGRDIPHSEQKYWKSFNILPQGGMSKVYFERSFEGKWADPNAENFIFQYKFKEFQEIWLKNIGWELIKPLTREDQYRLSSLRIPLSESQQEFDSLVENLSIIIVESLNSKELNKTLIEENLEGKINETKSIKKLELYFGIKKAKGYEKHIQFLKDLNWLRSKGASHRKGSKDFKKLKDKFLIDEKGYALTFQELMLKAIAFLDYLIDFSKK